MADYTLTIYNQTKYNLVIVKEDSATHEPGVVMDQSDWSGDNDPVHTLQGKEIKSNDDGTFNLSTKMGRYNPWCSMDLKFDNSLKSRITLTPQFDQDKDGIVNNDDPVHTAKGYARKNYVDSQFTVERKVNDTNYIYEIKSNTTN